MTHDFERSASTRWQPKRRAWPTLALGVGASCMERNMEDQTPAPSASRIPRAVKPTVIRRFQSAGWPAEVRRLLPRATRPDLSAGRPARDMRPPLWATRPSVMTLRSRGKRMCGNAIEGRPVRTTATCPFRASLRLLQSCVAALRRYELIFLNGAADMTYIRPFCSRSWSFVNVGSVFATTRNFNVLPLML
jgi:hypothetical protein